jgi:hypothetical protein
LIFLESAIGDPHRRGLPIDGLIRHEGRPGATG